jgi:ectoine hydroxylase-related dioxygenase (phytanoyl-CoA dioxygenase family)
MFFMSNSSLTPLSAEQLAFYYREGYLVVPNLVPMASVEAAKAAFDKPIEGKRWTPGIFDYNAPAEANAQQHRMLVEPNIIAAVEQIFEAPARVFYGMTAVVPARGGNGLPWHQDNQYSQVIPAALNTFVALCDITPDKAILWVAPGTHKLGTQPSKEAGGDYGAHRTAIVEPKNGFPLPGLKAGDVCIFDRNTYHRSLQNETDEHRFAYAAQYMASYSRMAESGQKPNKPMARDLQNLWKEQLGF